MYQARFPAEAVADRPLLGTWVFYLYSLDINAHLFALLQHIYSTLKHSLLQFFCTTRIGHSSVAITPLACEAGDVTSFFYDITINMSERGKGGKV